jgi:hypothetical protein
VSSTSSDGDGGNIKVSVTGGTGAIDTTNGNGGAIDLSTAGGNIRTSQLI